MHEPMFYNSSLQHDYRRLLRLTPLAIVPYNTHFRRSDIMVYRIQVLLKGVPKAPIVYNYWGMAEKIYRDGDLSILKSMISEKKKRTLVF